MVAETYANGRLGAGTCGMFSRLKSGSPQPGGGKSPNPTEHDWI